MKIMKYLCVWLIHTLLVMWAGRGRGGTDTASGHGESVPDRDRGGGDWSVRDQSRQGSPRDNTSAANANIIQVVSTLRLNLLQTLNIDLVVILILSNL